MKTNEQFLNERDQMLNLVGFECELVRPGSLSWEKGVIIGVMSDKRSNTNMYRCECTKDKKVVNKTKDNPLFKVLETKSTREIKSRTQSYDNMTKDDILKQIRLLEDQIKVLKSKLD